jgi:hypothetical protein
LSNSTRSTTSGGSVWCRHVALFQARDMLSAIWSMTASTSNSAGKGVSRNTSTHGGRPRASPSPVDGGGRRGIMHSCCPMTRHSGTSASCTSARFTGGQRPSPEHSTDGVARSQPVHRETLSSWLRSRRHSRVRLSRHSGSRTPCCISAAGRHVASPRCSVALPLCGRVPMASGLGGPGS